MAFLIEEEIAFLKSQPQHIRVIYIFCMKEQLEKPHEMFDGDGPVEILKYCLRSCLFFKKYNPPEIDEPLLKWHLSNAVENRLELHDGTVVTAELKNLLDELIFS